MDLSGTQSCRVPGLCPWAKLRDTNFKKCMSLDFWTRLRDTTLIFVSLIVSLSCPLIMSLRDTNHIQLFGQISEHLGHDTICWGTRSCCVPKSCPWIVYLNFLARLWRLRDMFRDTIQGHDTIPGTRHDSRDTTRFVSLKVPEISDTIRVPKGHD